MELIKIMSSLYLLSGETMLYTPVDAHFGPSQASKMDLFTRIVNGFNWTFFTIFAGSS